MKQLQDQKMRVGLIGAGYVSTYHIRALQRLENATVVGIADLDSNRAAELARRFGIPAVYGSLAEMRAAKPEVIHVLTPPASHHQLTMEALKMGCHVFVEKPMAESVGQCDEMIAQAREAGLVLSVNHSARMDPIVLEALKRVKDGACGEVLGVDFFRSSDYPPYAGGPVPAPYRKGSYPFQDLGVHGLYLLEAFLGRIESVDVRYASARGDVNLLFDEWRAMVHCAKGTGQMYLSWNVRPIQNELAIHGTRGVMRVDCFLQTCSVRRSLPAPKAIQLIFGAAGTSLCTLWEVGVNTLRFATGRLLPSPGIHVSVRRFYEELSKGAPPPIGAEEGRRMVAWMEEVSHKADAERRQRLAVEAPCPPMRVLVTGASGFLGEALLARLKEKGESIRVLLRRVSPNLEQDSRVQVVYGDLGDPDSVDRAVAGVEAVYHLGAAMRGGAADFERGTVWGTRNVVSACLRYGVKRLVYVSSLSVLDHAGHQAGTPVNEWSRLEPHPELRGGYTQTKLAAEQIVAEAIRDQGLPAVILRPGQIFGPGAERVPPSGTIRLGKRWVVVGSGSLRLPLVYVEDAVEALLLAERQQGICGLTFHVVDSEDVTQREYLEQCQRALGKEIHVSYVPMFVLYGLAVGVELLARLGGRRPPLSRYRLRSIRPLSPCDCTAAREKLGWLPRIGASEGLRRVFGIAAGA